MHNLLFSNGYSLLYIGSTMLIEGSHMRLGAIYTGLGLLLILVEFFGIFKKKDEGGH